jgi:ATP-dependent DNA helicase RecG
MLECVLFSSQDKGMYTCFSTALDSLPGLGSALSKRLSARDICCMGDLLFHLPRDYIHDSYIPSISCVKAGEEVRLKGRIIHKHAHGYGRKRQVTITLCDDTGEITLHFFHAGYLMSDARMDEGREISVRGKVDVWKHKYRMTHPDWCVAEQFVEGVKPIYGSVAGISGKRLHSFIEHALNILPPEASSPLDKWVDITLRKALHIVHRPKADIEERVQAIARLKTEELLVYLYVMQQQRRAAVCRADVFQSKSYVQKLIDALPYALTQGQQLAWQDIQQDLASGQRMHRLVQGDVGCGKTWVAALATVAVIENHQQVALMAPTEVLAQQHYQTFSDLLKPLGIHIALLTGSTRASVKKQLLSGLASGEIQCVVGTHALISDAVVYHKLGLAIVDEQHRFGVKQRWALTKKQGEHGQAVHLLGMTATPIPRSMAMAVYGDMDLSVMRGMPIGRKPVDTRVLPSSQLKGLAAGMQRLLDAQGRIYWIVPRIDEDEEAIGVSVAERVEILRKHFPSANVLGLHGRMKQQEKQANLDAFAQGSCCLLVSTTVVEVGVNVPEARLIVIDDADHYGLAQLHQLRGRVGRSDEQGYCILLASKNASKQAVKRLQMMVKSHDGLELAEADLQMRGAGDACGTRQSGDAGFQLLDIAQDAHLVRYWYEHYPDFKASDAMVEFWRPLAASVD